MKKSYLLIAVLIFLITISSSVLADLMPEDIERHHIIESNQFNPVITICISVAVVLVLVTSIVIVLINKKTKK